MNIQLLLKHCDDRQYIMINELCKSSSQTYMTYVNLAHKYE